MRRQHNSTYKVTIMCC